MAVRCVTDFSGVLCRHSSARPTRGGYGMCDKLFTFSPPAFCFVCVCFVCQGLDMSQLTNVASAYAMTSNVFFAIRGILSKKVSVFCFTDISFPLPERFSVVC